MEKKLHISTVIKNLRDSKASPEELSALNVILQQGSTEIDDLITTEWQNTSPQSTEIDSAKMLRAIHKKGQFKSVLPTKKAIKTSPTVKIRILQFTKYAAIFLIAFAIAWFLKTPKESADITNVTVAYGSKSTIDLPDGSVVVLNSGSKLTYPTNFGKDNRTVFLSGEGFFEVKKNSKWPFFVKTSGMAVKVTGTKFNVKAYPDENLTETTLVSGSVEIFEDKKEGSQKLLATLKPNQKAIFNRHPDSNIKPEKPTSARPTLSEKATTENESIGIEDDVKTEELTCWQNNVLVVNNEKLSDLTKKLERWYNVEISLKNNDLANIRFSGKFDKETIEEVLNALMFIQPFSYEITKNKITIKSKFNH